MNDSLSFVFNNTSGGFVSGVDIVSSGCSALNPDAIKLGYLDGLSQASHNFNVLVLLLAFGLVLKIVSRLLEKYVGYDREFEVGSNVVTSWWLIKLFDGFFFSIAVVFVVLMLLMSNMEFVLGLVGVG